VRSKICTNLSVYTKISVYSTYLTFKLLFIFLGLRRFADSFFQQWISNFQVYYHSIDQYAIHY